MKFDKQLDTTGLACPLPLLKTKQALHSLYKGQVLQVVATDLGSVRDIPAYLAQSDHVLLAFELEQASYIYLIKKG